MYPWQVFQGKNRENIFIHVTLIKYDRDGYKAIYSNIKSTSYYIFACYESSGNRIMFDDHFGAS